MSDELPPRETLLEFPCEFTIKIIGKAEESFEIEVLTLVRKHFPDTLEGALKLNHSRQKNYLAYSVSLQVQDQQTLDALYQDLSDSPLVLFAL